MYRLQGKLGVLDAITKFIENGYQVCEPVCDAYGYDLLVLMDGNFKKVQVKTSTFSPSDNNTLEYGLHRTSHNNSKIVSETYSSDDVDYFYLYSPTYPSKGCLIPFGFNKGKSVKINYDDVKSYYNQNMWFDYKIK